MENFLSNNEWARDPSFDHFWRHYAVCEEWRNYHNDAVRQVHSQHYTQSEVGPVEPAVEDVGIEEPELTERLSRCEIREEAENAEWQAFQAKTNEHRENLKKQRDAAEREKKATKPWLKGDEDEYVGVETLTVHGRVKQSANYQDVAAEIREKRESAKKKYGDAAPRILAMESRLEMNFESAFASNPQMWPNIPFRF